MAIEICKLGNLEQLLVDELSDPSKLGLIIQLEKSIEKYPKHVQYSGPNRFALGQLIHCDNEPKPFKTVV